MGSQSKLTTMAGEVVTTLHCYDIADPNFGSVNSCKESLVIHKVSHTHGQAKKPHTTSPEVFAAAALEMVLQTSEGSCQSKQFRASELMPTYSRMSTCTLGKDKILKPPKVTPGQMLTWTSNKIKVGRMYLALKYLAYVKAVHR